MVDELASLDIAISRIARRQHGVITARQLNAVGLSREAVRKRAVAGRPHRIHRGVYAVGHRALSQHMIWMAAVLACGDTAVLSHRSAAALWGFLRPEGESVHVSIPTDSGRANRNGIHLHRRISLATTAAQWFTRLHGIPVTTVQQTLDDLHGTIEPRLERRAIRQAELRGHRLKAHTRKRTKRTRSDLELAFLSFCDRHHLPPPEVNVKVAGYRVDFLWREQGVVVETDFFDYHRGSIAYEDDHRRDLDLHTAGFTVRHYTGDQLRAHPVAVADDLHRALSTWSTAG